MDRYDMTRADFWQWMDTCPTDKWECVQIEGDYCKIVFPLEADEEENDDD